MIASRSATYSSVRPSWSRYARASASASPGSMDRAGDGLHRRVALALSRTRVHGATGQQIEDTDHSHTTSPVYRRSVRLSPCRKVTNVRSRYSSSGTTTRRLLPSAWRRSLTVAGPCSSDERPDQRRWRLRHGLRGHDELGVDLDDLAGLDQKPQRSLRRGIGRQLLARRRLERSGGKRLRQFRAGRSKRLRQRGPMRRAVDDRAGADELLARTSWRSTGRTCSVERTVRLRAWCASPRAADRDAPGARGVRHRWLRPPAPERLPPGGIGDEVPDPTSDPALTSRAMAPSMSSALKCDFSSSCDRRARTVASDVRGDKARHIVDRVRQDARATAAARACETPFARHRDRGRRAGQRLLLRPVAHGEVIAGEHEHRRLEPQLRERAAADGQFLPRRRAPRARARCRCRNARGRGRRP